MTTIRYKKTDTAIVIGRFQVDELHLGHERLLDAAVHFSSRLIIVVGIAPRICTRANPLDFLTRSHMLKEAYPNAAIMSIQDQPNNRLWSQQLDFIIKSQSPTGTISLWAGQNSFADTYQGTYQIQYVDYIAPTSGSDIRAAKGFEIPVTGEGRQGILYAAYNTKSRAYPTIDVAIIKNVKTGYPITWNEYSLENVEVLLGKKDSQPGKMRFPGGFVDPTDKSMEQAVVREVAEETDLVVDLNMPEYIGSYRVEDWRDTPEDRIITTFFLTQYQWGGAKAGDDLNKVEWVTLRKIKESFKSNCIVWADDHRMLAAKLIEYVERQKMGIEPDTLRSSKLTCKQI